MANIDENIINLLNAKKRLKEFCKQMNMAKPEYTIVKKTTIKVQKFYTAQLIIDDIICINGVDISRRMAKCRAALNAINHFDHCENSAILINYQINFQNHMFCNIWNSNECSVKK